MEVSVDRRMEIMRDLVLGYLGAFNGPEMRPPDALSMNRFIDSIAQGINQAAPP